MTAAPDLVEEVVPVAGEEVLLLRPRDYDAMLTEEAFEREELLPYWAQLWPSGTLLAQVLATRQWRGRRVLELGCGLGLASIVAARGGASVTATDWSEAAVEAAAANAVRNGVELETAVADWERPDDLLAAAPWDCVIGADILYEYKKVATLLDLLPRLTGEVILADSQRASADPFFSEADREWAFESLRTTSEPQVTVHRLRRRRDRRRRRLYPEV